MPCRRRHVSQGLRSYAIAVMVARLAMLLFSLLRVTIYLLLFINIRRRHYLYTATPCHYYCVTFHLPFNIITITGHRRHYYCLHTYHMAVIAYMLVCLATSLVVKYGTYCHWRRLMFVITYALLSLLLRCCHRHYYRAYGARYAKSHALPLLLP